MKELVAERIPPADRWTLLESESDIVYGSLTDCLNLIFVVHKATQFFIDAKAGKVYISYQGAMEDATGDLLVLDHPYCNEYYEYAVKQRILENMIWQGENVSQQLGLVEQRLRASRNNALTFVNTPDFQEMWKVFTMNRRAQYHNYYNMFLSYAPRQPRVVATPKTISNAQTSITSTTGLAAGTTSSSTC